MSNQQYGLSVLGKVRVFSKTKTIQGTGKKSFDITDVWFNVSEKEDDGSYYNQSMNLLFKKDAPKPENNTVINIVSAFPVITGDGKYRRIALFVQEWAPTE